MNIEEILIRLEEFTEMYVNSLENAKIEIPYVNAIKLVDYIHNLQEYKRILYLILENKE